MLQQLPVSVAEAAAAAESLSSERGKQKQKQAQEQGRAPSSSCINKLPAEPLVFSACGASMGRADRLLWWRERRRLLIEEQRNLQLEQQKQQKQRHQQQQVVASLSHGCDRLLPTLNWPALTLRNSPSELTSSAAMLPIELQHSEFKLHNNNNNNNNRHREEELLRCSPTTSDQMPPVAAGPTSSSVFFEVANTNPIPCAVATSSQRQLIERMAPKRAVGQQREQTTETSTIQLSGSLGRMSSASESDTCLCCRSPRCPTQASERHIDGSNQVGACDRRVAGGCCCCSTSATNKTNQVLENSNPRSANEEGEQRVKRARGVTQKAATAPTQMSTQTTASATRLRSATLSCPLPTDSSFNDKQAHGADSNLLAAIIHTPVSSLLVGLANLLLTIFGPRDTGAQVSWSSASLVKLKHLVGLIWRKWSTKIGTRSTQNEKLEVAAASGEAQTVKMTGTSEAQTGEQQQQQIDSINQVNAPPATTITDQKREEFAQQAERLSELLLREALERATSQPSSLADGRQSESESQTASQTTNGQQTGASSGGHHHHDHHQDHEEAGQVGIEFISQTRESAEAMDENNLSVEQQQVAIQVVDSFASLAKCDERQESSAGLLPDEATSPNATNNYHSKDEQHAILDSVSVGGVALEEKEEVDQEQQEAAEKEQQQAAEQQVAELQETLEGFELKPHQQPQAPPSEFDYHEELDRAAELLAGKMLATSGEQDETEEVKLEIETLNSPTETPDHLSHASSVLADKLGNIEEDQTGQEIPIEVLQVLESTSQTVGEKLEPEGAEIEALSVPNSCAKLLGPPTTEDQDDYCTDPASGSTLRQLRLMAREEVAQVCCDERARKSMESARRMFEQTGGDKSASGRQNAAHKRGGSLSSSSNKHSEEDYSDSEDSGDSGACHRRRLDDKREGVTVAADSEVEDYGTIKLVRRSGSSASSVTNFRRTLVCSVSPTSQLGGSSFELSAGSGGSGNQLGDPLNCDEPASIYPIDCEEIDQCRAAFRENRRLIEEHQVRASTQARLEAEAPANCGQTCNVAASNDAATVASGTSPSQQQQQGTSRAFLVKKKCCDLSQRHPNCSRCDRRVYPVDKMELDFTRTKLNIHKNCFKCQVCSSLLRLETYAAINAKLYCPAHIKCVAPTVR